MRTASISLLFLLFKAAIPRVKPTKKPWMRSKTPSNYNSKPVKL
jgi:hypothetical protein